MAKLQQSHPSIDLQLAAINRVRDLAREQIDLAIRYGAGRWRELEVRLLMPELHFPSRVPHFCANTGHAIPQSC
jgi:LysR family glycine cleavage system transcriptional activator